MGDAPAFPEPSLGYRWVKANVYSALFYAVTGFATLALGKVLSVSNPKTGAATIAIFAVLAGLITALGLLVYARLTGGVLGRKLSPFPMRSWIALHVLAGFVFGMALSPAASVADEFDPEPLDAETIVLFTIASTIIGVFIGAIFGSLQAFVLRKVAHGLSAWIGFSGLAGAMLGPVVLAATLGPQGGLASDVMSEVAAFVVAVSIGIIMLPALRRLRPREVAVPAAPSPP